MCNPKVVDISSRAPGTPAWLDRLAPMNHLVQEVAKLQNLQKRVEEFRVRFRQSNKIQRKLIVTTDGIYCPLQ